MDILEGLTIEEGTGRKVCKLLKGLYRLKQSGRMWNQEWDRHLVGTCGFTRSNDDHAVYLKKNDKDDEYCWVLIWVDDVLWIGPRVMVEEAKAQLAKQFPVTNLGTAHFFLGIEIIRKHHQITLCQSAYIQKILKRFNLTDAHTVSTPLSPGRKLEGTPNGADEETDETVYRSMIGSLMYLMLCTRPDIAFTVGALSRYSSLPRTSHLNYAKHLLRYVKKTAHIGLRLGPFTTKNLHPILYSDADWAGDLDTRKSTSGYVCVLTDGESDSQGEPILSAVSWSAKDSRRSPYPPPKPNIWHSPKPRRKPYGYQDFSPNCKISPTPLNPSSPKSYPLRRLGYMLINKAPSHSPAIQSSMPGPST